MSALEALLVRQIHAHGPLTFAEFMDLALYHPEYGYYGSGAVRTGREGHFMTSPELDPAFGSLWSTAFERVWVACGRPARFEVVEIGPGEGGMAAAVLEAASGGFRAALRYRLIERVPAVEARQRARLGGMGQAAWSRTLEEAIAGDGVVFANEVLDNLPVRIFGRGPRGVMEVTVTEDGGRLRLGAIASEEHKSEDLGLEEAGGVAEVRPGAAALAASAAGAIEKGAVVFVDYGNEGGGARRDTLVAYSGAAVDDVVLDRPGERDLTAHVDWGPVRSALERCGLEPLHPRSQRDVLLDLGARTLDRDLERAHKRAVESGTGGEAVRALSRRQSLRAMLDPGGLGSLDVVAATKGVPASALFSG